MRVFVFVYYTKSRLVIIILCVSRGDEPGGRVCLHLFYGVSVTVPGNAARASGESLGALSGLKTSYVGINQRSFDSLPQRRLRTARKLILI